MRIVHLCRVGWPHVGGMETVMGQLAAAQRRAGHEVWVVTLDRTPQEDFPLRPQEIDGVPYLRLPRLGPRRWPAARGLGAALRGAQVIHVHGVDGLLDQALLTRPWHGAAVGVSTHGAYFHTDRARLGKRLWLRTATRLSLGAADAVWYDSESDRRTLSAAGAAGQVLPSGLDLSAHLALSRAPEPGRWLVPGRVDLHKGIDDLIDAIGQMEAPPRAVRVVGPSSIDLTGLQRRAAAAGVEITWVGPVDEAVWLGEFAAAERVVFPSRHEGFGVAVVEALAAGHCPWISDIPAHRALAEGVGEIVPFRDAVAAARALARPSACDASCARAAALPFTWEAMLPRWDAAYAAMRGRR